MDWLLRHYPRHWNQPTTPNKHLLLSYIMFSRYFSLQAESPLGFPDSIRFEIEGNICREEGPLPDCFSKPRKIVLHTIQRVRLFKILNFYIRHYIFREFWLSYVFLCRSWTFHSYFWSYAVAIGWTKNILLVKFFKFERLCHWTERSPSPQSV